MHYAADQQAWQDNDNPLVVRDYNAPAIGREINMIHSWHRILPSVGCADREGNKRSDLQMLADVASHIPANLSRRGSANKYLRLRTIHLWAS